MKKHTHHIIKRLKNPFQMGFQIVPKWCPNGSKIAPQLGRSLASPPPLPVLGTLEPSFGPLGRLLTAKTDFSWNLTKIIVLFK